jgi:hypothetical protein
MSNTHKQKISELLTTGLDGENIIGYHGTSIEAIWYLAQKGNLPANGRHPGKLYFYPLQDEDIEKQQYEASVYSRWNAWKHYIIQKLPFTPNHEDICNFRDIELEELPHLHAQCKAHNISEQQIARWLGEALEERNGVIITLSHQVTPVFDVKIPSQNEKYERYIDVPQGFPIQYIAGIEPLGQYEWQALQKFQAD